MDHYQRIQHAIDFMEEHLQEELLITDIAAKAYFSAFHFQRLFQAISGFTVQEYIRKRRLSEAAVLLAETRMNVLSVALSCQYQSQEAFTRAFEKCFKITPGAYRRSGADLPLQQKLNFLDYQTRIKGEITLNKPSIVEFEDIHIVGREYKTSLREERNYEEIPGFYADFGRTQYDLRIPEKIAPDRVYGIACQFRDNGDFSFVIGEEANDTGAELKEECFRMSIPAGKYAEFKVNGSVDLVQNTRRYIYGTWLPNSNYEPREAPDFEVMDVRGSSFPKGMKISILIPIK